MLTLFLLSSPEKRRGGVVMNKKKLIVLRLVVLIIFFVVSPGFSAEKADVFSLFLSRYSMVSHYLKSDESVLDKLKILAELDFKTADFLVTFWEFMARNECYRPTKEIAEQITNHPIESEREALLAKQLLLQSHCLYAAYYDHWDEINESIRNAYERAMKQPKKQD
jgi:hypothetical protein